MSAQGSTAPLKHSIAVSTHGHFLVEEASAGGGADGGATGQLVGFHGYAETAADSLEALGRIPGSRAWHRCAIQGLHVFYRRRTGQVVASWMTGFERELAIGDNVAYAAAVLSDLNASYGIAGPRVLAGFSQGVAMAYRTAAFAGHALDGLIVLAGDVPPDLGGTELAALPPILIGRGETDGWYTDAKLEADAARLEAAGARVETCRFAGGHEWAEPFLAKAGSFLARLREG